MKTSMRTSSKNLLVLFLAAFAAQGAFAHASTASTASTASPVSPASPASQTRYSAGTGGFFGNDFGGGTEYSLGGLWASKMETPYQGGGAYVFFDAAFIEASTGIFFGGGPVRKTLTVLGAGGSDSFDSNFSSLNIGLLGKYPFKISGSLTLFPLLGIDIQIVLSAVWDDKKFEGNYNNGGPIDLTALWFKFGGGVDYSLTSKIFLRAEALYGIRSPNIFEIDIVNEFDASDVTANTLLGHGFTIKLAVGYRL